MWVLVGGKHTVTRRHSDCSWCECEQAQVGYFQVSGWGGWCTPWCAFVCVCAHAVCEQAYEGAGSHRGLSNISSVNSDESYCSWEYVCMRVWSVFVKTLALVYLRWSRGPSHHQKTETHHSDMACIFYWIKQLCLCTPPLRTLCTVDSWMCAGSFVWSTELISSLTVPFSLVFVSTSYIV